MRIVAAAIMLCVCATRSLYAGNDVAGAIFLSGGWICVALSGVKNEIVDAIEKRSAK